MATRRRGRALLFVAVILILLLVVVVAGWQLFLGPILDPGPVAQEPVVLPTETPVPNLVYIVMTSQKIPRGAYLTADSLVLIPIPRQDYVEGTFIKQDEAPGDPNTPTVIDDLIANGYRAGMDLKEKTPLTMELLVGEKGNPSSFQIQAGMVAISIPVSKLSSVAYGLQPGDHVNVIASLLLIDLDPNFQSRLPNSASNVTLPGRLADAFTGVAAIDDGVAGRGEFDPTLGTPIYVYASEAQRPRLVSQTIINDSIVLQVGNFTQGVPEVEPTPVPADPNAPPPDGQAVPQPTPEPTFPDVITLIVKPQDAVTLNYLMLAGARINLVMRAAGDTAVNDVPEAVTLQYIMDQYLIPNPAKLPYGVEPRVDNFVTNNNNVLPFPDAAGTPVPVPPLPVPAP